MSTTRFEISILRSTLELLGIVFARFRPVQRIWAIWLVAVNAASVVFVDHIEAQVTLAVVVVAVLVQALIYQRERFIRLLGVAHILWVPMLAWIAVRLDTLPAGESAYHAWLVTLIATNVISLVIDAWDVKRFMLGERKPHYVW